MEIRLDNFSESTTHFFRRCGYNFHGGELGGEQSFVRRMGHGDYPRFHAYVKIDGGALLISLHLDHKKPSYDGEHAHNAEYEGELVLEEMYSIKEHYRKTER